MEEKERQEVFDGYFVGDTVILKEETELTKKQNFKLGTIAVVSKNDTKESLKGWSKVNLEEEFRKEIEKMSPETIKELYDKLAKIGKIKNADKLDEIARKLSNT